MELQEDSFGRTEPDGLGSSLALALLCNPGKVVFPL